MQTRLWLTTTMAMPHANGLSTEARRCVRLLGDRIKQSDDNYVRTASLLCEPVRDRLKRYPRRTVRDDMLFDLAQGFRKLQPDWRLVLDIARAEKRHFELVDYRLSSSEWFDDRWVEPEWQSSIAICKVTVEVDAHGVEAKTIVLVNLSYHALGRWFERTQHYDYTALLTDLRPLIASAAVDRVPCGTGFWLGHIGRAHSLDGRQFNTRSVSSYLAVEQVEEPLSSTAKR
jgi:hypothetical protein